MNVSFDINNQNIKAQENITSQGKSEAVKPQGSVSGVTVDLFAKGTDTDAYKGAPKTMEEVLMDQNAMDVKNNSDYKVIMSNCMSDEDFSKLLKDGTHPGNTEIETVVTIVDTIKAELAKSGKVVAGYNDDIDRETLIEITGSEAFANKLSKSFSEKDIPLTRENAEMAKEVYDRIGHVDTITEDAAKYMVENNLEPTADNLYMASYSVKTGANRQRTGYFANDMQGYYSQKAEAFNWTNLQPQMEKVIEMAGYEVTDETLMDSMWIIKNGIPFTVESFGIYEKVKGIDFTKKEDLAFDAIAAAIADGKPAKAADFSDTSSALEKAVLVQNAIEEITTGAVDLCLNNGQNLNIRNLSYWQKQIDAGYATMGKEEAVTDIRTQAGGVSGINADITAGQSAYLTLEEVRLQMSVEANYRLLKSGYQIDVADLTKLVDDLKNENHKMAEALFGKGDELTISHKQALYKEAVNKVEAIPTFPAAALGRFVGSPFDFTLNNVYETGLSLKSAYEAANQSYETMMTAPRRDMGDSIKKAFRNVDDILLDMEYVISEENRKAVRTLGYNNIPLTDENIQKAINANRQVENVLDRMSPSAIMQMIKEGQNPLEMQFVELENYLIQNEATLQGDANEQYADYLYQLEQNKEISDVEREAYVGVLRLIHQIKKSDGGAVGSLVNSGLDINFKNLLSAVRSKNKGHIDTLVDENTGLNEGRGDYLNSITAQIERAFKAQIKSLPSYEETLSKYEHNKLSDIQNLAQVSDNIIDKLLQNDLPVTADNLFAANALMNMEYQIYRNIGKKFKEAEALKEAEEFEKACEDFTKTFEGEEEAAKGVSDFTKKIQELLTADSVEENAKALDIRELGLLHKQVGMIRNFAGEREYNVPLMVDGNLTSVHLTLVKNEDAPGDVNISMETSKYGMVGGKFSEENNFTTGYLVCENGFDAQTKDMFTKSFAMALREDSLTARDISFMTAKEIHPENFGKENGKQVSDKADTKTLYKVAKAFIKAVQEAM